MGEVYIPPATAEPKHSCPTTGTRPKSPAFHPVAEATQNPWLLALQQQQKVTPLGTLFSQEHHQRQGGNTRGNALHPGIQHLTPLPNNNDKPGREAQGSAIHAHRWRQQGSSGELKLGQKKEVDQSCIEKKTQQLSLKLPTTKVGQNLHAKPKQGKCLSHPQSHGGSGDPPSPTPPLGSSAECTRGAAAGCPDSPGAATRTQAPSPHPGGAGPRLHRTPPGSPLRPGSPAPAGSPVTVAVPAPLGVPQHTCCPKPSRGPLAAESRCPCPFQGTLP
ncbi:basic salivary proline-rich protein 4-like [Neophocaena asiaeorientalis asiaeorientalis]|uniref:Basic salivary proline-rich protein 4-like n=1 Tax=Neophocaena asiaeorientalis asiaeorientalis TaxID=1706337 RepID=A0A341CK05_NEOAA|nr:basic salivary proline-rich protein 4-like [Neophocaena asiaeorientalis asiaeorientalis]